MTWTTLVDAATLRAADLKAADLRLLDARATAAVTAGPSASEAAYRQAHIPGAVYVDLHHDLADLSRSGEGRHPLPDEAAFARRLGEWGIGPATQVVVYDAGDGSMAAARAWWLLKLIGHPAVAVLDGGLAAWQAAGGAVTQDVVPPPARGAYPGRFDRSRVLDAAQVQDMLAAGSGVLWDARAPERFRGEVEPIDPVAGHVPAAFNRPYAANVAAGRLRDAAQLRAEFAGLLQGRPASEAVMMCGSGVTACHLLLALEHAGLPGAKLYAGSWSGWIADPARPVATTS